VRGMRGYSRFNREIHNLWIVEQSVLSYAERKQGHITRDFPFSWG